MSTVRTSFRHYIFGACLCAAFVLPSLAFAQQGRSQAQPEDLNLFQRIERWFEQQAANVGSTVQGAGREVETLGVEAGIAAKTTVEGAKGAADAVARIPNARVVRGHSKCRNAPNGAPDCVAAATALCRSQGFDTRQERRHDHCRSLPAQGLYGRPQQWPRMPDRNLRVARPLPIAGPAAGPPCHRPDPVFRFVKSETTGADAGEPVIPNCWSVRRPAIRSPWV